MLKIINDTSFDFFLVREIELSYSLSSFDHCYNEEMFLAHFIINNYLL